MAVAALRARLIGAGACLLLAACGGQAAASGTSAPPVAPADAGAGGSSAAGRPPGTDAVSVPVAGAPPVAGHPWYLAVGDSITSGFTIDSSRAGTNSAWPLQLQGMLAARGQVWSLFDTACPGETTASYATGCHDRQIRDQLGGGTQHDTALAAIRSHLADLKLILVDLGSNDLLRALRSGGDPATAVARLTTSLSAIVAELHAAAPGVPLVLTTFFNPLANLLPATEGQVTQVNAAIVGVARAEGATVADFHAAVNTAAPPDPHLCEVIDCAHLDIHPTVGGHRLLARTALAAIPAP